jgi:hypothetical protein
MDKYKYATFGLILAALAAALLAVAGCGANFFACTTKASFNKDGTWSYESCKNQENFKAEIGKDRAGNPLAKVETTATTPEAAIAAAAEALKEAFVVLKDAMAMAKAAASKGAAQ